MFENLKKICPAFHVSVPNSQAKESNRAVLMYYYAGTDELRVDTLCLVQKKMPCPPWNVDDYWKITELSLSSGDLILRMRQFFLLTAGCISGFSLVVIQ